MQGAPRTKTLTEGLTEQHGGKQTDHAITAIETRQLRNEIFNQWPHNKRLHKKGLYRLLGTSPFHTFSFLIIREVCLDLGSRVLQKTKKYYKNPKTCANTIAAKCSIFVSGESQEESSKKWIAHPGTKWTSAFFESFVFHLFLYKMFSGLQP